MMIKNYDEPIKMNHNTNWPYVPNYRHRILIIGGSGSSKSNVLINLIKSQRPDIGKFYLYVKKIRLNQSVNCLSIEEKMQGLKNKKM